MRLAILSVQSNKHYEAAHGIKTPINFQSHHISQIFLHFLRSSHQPEPDGSGRLTVLFEEPPERYFRLREDDAKYRESGLLIAFHQTAEGCGLYVRDGYFHVSEYYVGEETQRRAEHLKPEERNAFYLAVLMQAFRAMAEANHWSEAQWDVVEQAARQVEACGFSLTLPVKKLSGSSADRRYRAAVYRQLDGAGELWTVEITEKGDKKNKIPPTTTRYKIMEHPTFITLIDKYKTSRWEGHCFLMEDRLGNVTASIDAEGGK